MISVFVINVFIFHVRWGPCPHSMAHPQVADGGTASAMEGSCEYIE
jgi:hypothetical protein